MFRVFVLLRSAIIVSKFPNRPVTIIKIVKAAAIDKRGFENLQMDN